MGKSGIKSDILSRMQNQKPIYDMGNATTEVFKGNSISDSIKQIYGESAGLFSNLIKSKLIDTKKEYTLLDIGSSKGELLADILELLPEYNFKITITDTNPDAVLQNCIDGEKIVADAESLPFNDKSFDLVIVRYVLQFNLRENQKSIIGEISRVTKGFAIVQHGGADSFDPESWREIVSKIFIDDGLPQIKRSGMYWSTVEEIENCMDNENIKYERILSKKIQGLSQPFIERYSLSSEQASKLRVMLGDKDFLTQTTWIIYPKE